MSRSPSRRLFLRRLAGGAAAGGFLSLGGLSPALAAAAPGDAFWRIVRQQFPFSDDKVPMNAANLCPSPLAVSRKVSEWTRDIDVDCSFNNRAKFKQTLEDSRAKVAAQLGVSADEIALVRNTSEGNNTVNNGLALTPGAEIVLWDENHPTNNVAWEVRAKRFGLSIKRVATPPRPGSLDDLVEPFRKALGPRTRVLSFSHVSNVSGVRLPVRELAAIAHRRGIWVHVDGAQTWGALDVDLRELDCDSYAASAHKWFVGPKEVGVLYVKEERIGEIWPNVVAPGWGDGPETELKGARKFESMGQRDDAALAAVAVTADFRSTITPARVEQRVLELAANLKAGLSDAGAKLVTPRKPELSAGVVIIEVPAENRQEVIDAFYHEHGIAGSTSGGFRLCPHVYNTDEHVERAIAAVRAVRKWLA